MLYNDLWMPRLREQGLWKPKLGRQIKHLWMYRRYIQDSTTNIGYPSNLGLITREKSWLDFKFPIFWFEMCVYIDPISIIGMDARIRVLDPIWIWLSKETFNEQSRKLLKDQRSFSVALYYILLEYHSFLCSLIVGISPIVCENHSILCLLNVDISWIRIVIEGEWESG